MAATGSTAHSISISTSSYETALCIIPATGQCHHIDNLRSLYDKAYSKWPPHINIVYPFVAIDSLPQAKERIQARLSQIDCSSMNISLAQAGYFTHQTNSTIFLSESQRFDENNLKVLREAALEALGQELTPCNFHLTVGQSEDNSVSSREFLLSKAKLVPRLEIAIPSLAILIRESIPGEERPTSIMRLWDTIELPNASSSSPLSDFWLEPGRTKCSDSKLVDIEEVNVPDTKESSSFSRAVQPGTTYHFATTYKSWDPYDKHGEKSDAPVSLTVSSYNVLIDSVYPPARDRDPLLVSTIGSPSALADVLILQEVSDEFLSYLLADSNIQQHYPFASHGPPSQPDIGPLPSLRNVVVLSRWPFRWELVPFHRRHKGAVVAEFFGGAGANNGISSGFAVAGIHLTCGLTDGSVAAKKVQVHNLKNHLLRKYPSHSWVIAGDFNITTSAHTIAMALKNKSISSETVSTLSGIETTLSDVGLLDTWSVARVEAVDATIPSDLDHLFEGEDGATFDPMNNVLAAATSGTSNNRPQRYDRILVRPQGDIRITGFNQFGLPDENESVKDVPSDHSGIRTSLEMMTESSSLQTPANTMISQHPVEYKQATAALGNSSALVSALSNHNVFPTTEEIKLRKDAFALIKKTLLGTTNDEESSTADIPLVIVSVGSYALSVWTSASDIDCLCIGSISPKTFFKLARQRILKAEALGVRLLRKVQANTGTMLELSVNGVNLDLQYCPAGRVLDRWQEFDGLDASDPAFSLPILSLRKLKPYRDFNYIQRTIPSISAFRLGYRGIKLWATQRGIYSAKFGYLGGIHITLMLSWVCKRLGHDFGSVTATDLIRVFFHHYANFNWQDDMAFDAFFHKKKPRYQRSAREPMVILGFHAPNANVSHTSTVPGLRTLVKEFVAADECLSQPDMTWGKFLGGISTSVGISGFLSSHDNYAKIDIQYWGRTLSKGKSLVGWVESRCLLLVVDIHKAFPHLDVRIWPARFTDNEPTDSETDYHGCYLIGLSKNGSDDISTSKLDRLEARETMQKLLDKFQNLLQADEKYYDPTSSWIGTSIAKPSDIKNMQLDNRDWGNYIPDLDPDSDDDEEAEDFDDEADDWIAPTRKLPPRPHSTSTPLSTSKLRPSSDVINRLRWDPNLDPSEYIIGYEDRFLGAKETTLEKWKTEQTDEEFIPQHRILYFKRKGEDGGEVVWERATRIDKIFGSGAGAGGVLL